MGGSGGVHSGRSLSLWKIKLVIEQSITLILYHRKTETKRGVDGFLKKWLSKDRILGYKVRAICIALSLLVGFAVCADGKGSLSFLNPGEILFYAISPGMPLVEALKKAEMLNSPFKSVTGFSGLYEMRWDAGDPLESSGKGAISLKAALFIEAPNGVVLCIFYEFFGNIIPDTQKRGDTALCPAYLKYASSFAYGP